MILARSVRMAFKVKRYHTEECIQEENVGEHTAGVVALCFILCDGLPSGSLIANAVFHDFAEKWTGDVPYPVKRDNPDVKLALDAREERILKQELVSLAPLTPDDTLILKAADMLQLCYKARGEIGMGNQFFRQVLANGILALRGLQLQGGPALRLANLITDVDKEWEF